MFSVCKVRVWLKLGCDLSPYPTDNSVHVGYPTRQKRGKQPEINVKTLRWAPNATYIPLTLVGGFALGVTQILGLASGVTQIFAFLDTNMLVSPTLNSGIVGLDKRKAQCENFASQ